MLGGAPSLSLPQPGLSGRPPFLRSVSHQLTKGPFAFGSFALPMLAAPRRAHCAGAGWALGPGLAGALAQRDMLSCICLVDMARVSLASVSL